jgi:hypothetical protein
VDSRLVVRLRGFVTVLRADERCVLGRGVDRQDDIVAVPHVAETFPAKALIVRFDGTDGTIEVCGARPVEVTWAHPMTSSVFVLDPGARMTISPGHTARLRFVGAGSGGVDVLVEVSNLAVPRECVRIAARSGTTSNPELNLDTEYGRVAVCLYLERRRPAAHSSHFSNETLLAHYAALYGNTPMVTGGHARWIDKRLNEIHEKLEKYIHFEALGATRQRARLAAAIDGLGIVTPQYVEHLQRAGRRVDRP